MQSEEKCNLTVAKLAKRANVAPHVVRLYARKGLLPSTTRTIHGYRLFGEADVVRLRFIRVAQSLGFTLAEIREITDMARRSQSPCPQVRATVSHRLKETWEELRYLEQITEHMRNAIQKWDDMPDKVPTGHEVCHLIETIGAEYDSIPCHHHGVHPDGVAKLVNQRRLTYKKESGQPNES